MLKTVPDYENTIRSSNTVFSTMICSECGKRLAFESHGSYVIAYCPTKKHYGIEITTAELCGLINHNGLNSLVTPCMPIKVADFEIDNMQTASELPDGFKIEPIEKGEK